MDSSQVATVIIPPGWAMPTTATPIPSFSTEDLLEVQIRHLLVDREHHIALAIEDERLLAALGRKVSKPLDGR